MVFMLYGSGSIKVYINLVDGYNSMLSKKEQEGETAERQSCLITIMNFCMTELIKGVFAFAHDEYYTKVTLLVKNIYVVVSGSYKTAMGF